MVSRVICHSCIYTFHSCIPGKKPWCFGALVAKRNYSCIRGKVEVKAEPEVEVEELYCIRTFVARNLWCFGALVAK